MRTVQASLLSYSRCQLSQLLLAVQPKQTSERALCAQFPVDFEHYAFFGSTRLLSVNKSIFFRQPRRRVLLNPEFSQSSWGAMSSGREITHVLFDMDGLLLNTEDFYTVVQEELCASFGKQFSWDLKAKMMGKKALEAGKILVSELHLEGIITPEEFIKRREEKLHDLFPTTELMPGVERLIYHLHKHNIPMAVATSSHASHFKLKTTKHRELFSHMHHIVVGDDTALVNGKPAPDIFLLAASRFHNPPPSANTLVFEDAPIGVQAAVAASMPVVMVPHPQLDKGLIKGANEVLKSLEDFDPSGWGLPPFAA